MNPADKKSQFKNVLEHAQQELNSLRSNRATPSLIEHIRVDVYGAKTPLVQVASITSPEPRQLLVEPWDKNILKDVERAIQSASLGLVISNEGNFLRIRMPEMTEETRQQVIKLLQEKLEKSRIAIRGVRDKIKEEIVAAERNKEITEDEKYDLIEELNKMTRDFIDQINQLGERKEKEILL